VLKVCRNPGPIAKDVIAKGVFEKLQKGAWSHGPTSSQSSNLHSYVELDDSDDDLYYSAEKLSVVCLSAFLWCPTIFMPAGTHI